MEALDFQDRCGRQGLQGHADGVWGTVALIGVSRVCWILFVQVGAF